MVIPRRAFTLTLLTGLTSPRMLHAQSAKGVARIGFLAPGGPGIDSWGASVETFRQALRELGWVDGQNLVIDVRYAEGRYDRLPDLAAELVALKPDVIFAGAVNSAQAAKRATTTIPIVMETLGDAVSTGLVTNLARPGGNITGVSGFAPELSAKRLELLREDPALGGPGRPAREPVQSRQPGDHSHHGVGRTADARTDPRRGRPPADRVGQCVRHDGPTAE